MSRISKQVEVLAEEQKAAAMGELDLTPVSVGDPAGVSVVAPVADDSPGLDDLIGSLQDDA